MKIDYEKAKQLALPIIKKAESCYLTAYLCPAGKWTIAYGHTKGVKKGDKCTLGQAYKWLDEDVNEVIELIKHYAKGIDLNTHQFAALIDFTFNLGIERLLTSKVFAAIKKNPMDKNISSLFLNWVYGGDGSHNGIDDDCDGIVDEPGEKKRLPGLVTRRFNDANLYFMKEGN